MKKILFLLAIVTAFLAVSALYVIDEREVALKFRLGEIIAVIDKPGLYFKTPFINNVEKFDKRIQTLDEAPDRFLTSEKKNVIVDSYLKWRIKDARRFYTSTGGRVDFANARFSELIKNGLKNAFGKRTITEVVSGERNVIMRQTMLLAKKDLQEFGVEIIDLRIKRIDLSREINNSVYRRMEAERQRVAKDFRAKGAEAAERIRAEADKKRTIILADAYRDSEKIKGDGDARSSKIYAESYTKNESFYDFYRSLESYQKSFNNKNDMMVLEPTSDFFRHFNPKEQK